MSKVPLPAASNMWYPDPDGEGECLLEYYVLDELLGYAAARVAEALEASGWQPIDTAPRDGTEFQAWAFGGWETRCRIDPETEEFQVWNRSEYDQEGWASIPREKVRAWMPKPAAPNTHPA